MRILAVIPSRYGSTRLPGKPLAMIGDKPMIRWVWEATKRYKFFDDVIVATDDVRIVDCVRKFGGRVMWTEGHRTGSDAVADVARRYDFDVVVNVQGDRPFVTPSVLRRLISPYLGGERPEMVTVVSPLISDRDYLDPNVVKAVCDKNGNAMYFSRSPIPYFRNGKAEVLRSGGLYAFTWKFLQKYAEMESTPLEMCEGLEQMRVLEHGHSIRAVRIDDDTFGVDTPHDLEKARRMVESKNLNKPKASKR